MPGCCVDLNEVKRLVNKGASLAEEFGGIKPEDMQPIYDEDNFTGKTYIGGIVINYGKVKMQSKSAISVIDSIKEFLHAEEGNANKWVTNYRTKEGKTRNGEIAIEVYGQPQGKRTEILLVPEEVPINSAVEIPQTAAGYFDRGKSTAWVRVDKHTLKRTKTRKPSVLDIVNFKKSNEYTFEIRQYDPGAYEMINRSFVLGTLLGMGELLPKGLRYARTLETLLTSNQKKVGWDDIGGYEELRDNLRTSLLGPIKNPEIYDNKNPPNVILTGPPGTGKTLMVGALVNDLEGCIRIPFKPEYISNMFGSKEVGITQLFEWLNNVAEDSGKYVFLIYDEIDEIGNRFAGTPSVVINNLLRVLDGHEQYNFSIIATTNKPADLDPALYRPGRFHPIYYVQTPGTRDREDILGIYAKQYHMDEIDISSLAKETEGYTGAELNNIFIEARNSVINKIAKEKPIETITKNDIILTQQDLMENISSNKERITNITENWESTFNGLLKQLKDVKIISTRNSGVDMFQ